jgi:hypothetical protein
VKIGVAKQLSVEVSHIKCEKKLFGSIGAATRSEAGRQM